MCQLLVRRMLCRVHNQACTCAAPKHTDAHAQALYKASKKRFDEEEDFKARAREAVTLLQAGDPVFEQARVPWRQPALALHGTLKIDEAPQSEVSRRTEKVAYWT